MKRSDLKRGDRVEVRNIPWKGVIGTYIGPGRILFRRCYIVELGDMISGGTPRRVKVTKVRPVEEDGSREG